MAAGLFIGIRAGTALVLAAALSAGCANRDSITVGAVPDDYRTNHPIVISEKTESIDLPVGPTDRAVTSTQRYALEGFLSAYDASGEPLVTVMRPSGSFNEAAASHVAGGLTEVIARNGVPRHRIAVTAYAADPNETQAPIRVSYTQMKASTGPCGRWDADLGDTRENRHYTNFGCSYQNNLAAQIANPSDLLGPRKPTPIDAENRGNAIDDYKARIVAPEFRSNREIFY